MCHLLKVQLFAITWTVDLLAPLSMGFPRQDYQSGLPFPTPGDLPNPGIKPRSLKSPDWQADSFLLCHLGRPQHRYFLLLIR